jgi:hypothetical protein
MGVRRVVHRNHRYPPPIVTSYHKISGDVCFQYCSFGIGPRPLMIVYDAIAYEDTDDDVEVDDNDDVAMAVSVP